MLALFALVICNSFVNDIDNAVKKKYGLANRDLAPQNFFIDKNFKIVSIINLDFVIAAPKHVTANLPSRFGSELDVSLDALGVAKRTKEYFATFAKAGKPDFETLVYSSFGQLWAELQEDLFCNVLEIAV